MSDRIENFCAHTTHLLGYICHSGASDSLEPFPFKPISLAWLYDEIPYLPPSWRPIERIFYRGDIYVHAKAYAFDHLINPGDATKLQAELQYKKGRLEEAKSKALRAAGVYEKLGATRPLEEYRKLLQEIKERMAKIVVQNGSSGYGVGWSPASSSGVGGEGKFFTGGARGEVPYGESFI